MLWRKDSPCSSDSVYSCHCSNTLTEQTNSPEMHLKTLLQNTSKGDDRGILLTQEEMLWSPGSSDLQDLQISRMLNMGSKPKSSSRDQATTQLNLSPSTHTHKKKPQTNNQNCSLLYLKYVLILSVILLIFLGFFPPFFEGWDGKNFSFHESHLIILPTGRTESEAVLDWRILRVSKQGHSTHRSLGPKQN